MKRIPTLIVIGLFVLALFPRCAKTLSPTGGPKDSLAPVMVNSIPKLNATNFKGNEVVFEFDEYVQIKDAQKKMLVSPPLKYQPQANLKGKKIIVEITDTLKENTTYTIYLGDAVSDNNEGNPISSFEFAFSTGASIDTLSLRGRVENAFTHKPEEGALVMLYDTFSDSLPYSELPTHMAKTNKNGEFKVNNLKRRDYKLVTITDANSNYKYNQGIEDIGYCDGIVSKEELFDSTRQSKIVLRTFREELPNQIITGYERPDSNQLILNFSRKPVGGFKLTPLDEPMEKDWYITEPDAQGDTIKIWIASPKLVALDTLKVIALYQKTDSLNILNQQADTLKFIFYKEDKAEKKSKSKRKEKDETEAVKPTGFPLTPSVASGKEAVPDLPFEFTIPAPALKVDPSQILIFNETDSVMEPSVSLSVDSLNPRIYRFWKAWKPKKSYKMLVLPGAFENISLLTNDTLKLQFTGAEPENYGLLRIKTSNVSHGIVAELLNEKGGLAAKKSVVGNQTITFTYITPGKYKLRFTEDLNLNGIWDSGSYLKKIQPERIFEFTEGKKKGEINIRANWENDVQYAVPNP